MKQITQLIAAGGIAVSLLLLNLSSAPAFVVRGYSATQHSNNKTARAGRDARELFEGKCATCHGKDGRAKTFKAKFNKARDLTDAAWQASVSDERIYNSIANGRGKMPAFAKKFSREEIETLASYVRSLKK
ncbi:MAG TPA: c-type cytochrome [Pyrinomonadaceae bacterium]|nr:c-type cytochrome [Pyrinomonadaceae bacterium]